MRVMAMEASVCAVLNLYCRSETGSACHCTASFCVLRIVAMVAQRNRSSHVVEAARIIIMSQVRIGGTLCPARECCLI
jgi:hypothetical protein